MKKSMIITIYSILVCISILSESVNAGSVNFTGKVDGRLRCSAFLGSSWSSSGSFRLPSLSASSLSRSGDSAGNTPFEIQVICDCEPVRCDGPNVYPNVRVFFETGNGVDYDTGLLNNTTSVSEGGAGNVKIQLLDGNNNYTPIKAGSYKNTSSTNYKSIYPFDDRYVGALKYIFPFVARYYATGATTPGKVSAVVTYVIDFT